jgi:glycosyltransferase involved in cell wall biosynthesis
MEKTVVFFINNLGMGGAEKVFIADANALHREGRDVRMVLLYGGPEKNPWLDRLELPQDRIVFLRAKHIKDRAAYRELRSLLKSLPDAVLFATLHDATFVSRIVSLGLKHVRLVTREANTVEKKTFLHKLADGLMNARVDVMIAVSEEVKRSLASYQPQYANKISVLYNGVDFPADASHTPDDGLRVLNVGSLTPKKAQDVLLDAFALVAKEFPNATLRIVGDGVLREALKAGAEKLNVSQHVHFLGNKSFTEVQNEYRNADLFVLSSDQEGCPNVLLEAMSYGVPSIATSVGAVPEIITDGENGLVVPRRDPAKLAVALRALLSDAGRREKLGAAGRERIREAFTAEKHLNFLKQKLNI